MMKGKHSWGFHQFSDESNPVPHSWPKLVWKHGSLLFIKDTHIGHLQSTRPCAKQQGRDEEVPILAFNSDVFFLGSLQDLRSLTWTWALGSEIWPLKSDFIPKLWCNTVSAIKQNFVWTVLATWWVGSTTYNPNDTGQISHSQACFISVKRG